MKELNTEKKPPLPDCPKQPARRRLSVGDIDGSGIRDRGDNRGLIRELDMKALLDLCPETRGRGGRRFSVGTHTDHDMHRRGSYCEKSIMASGASFEGGEHGIGFACKKGLKPVSPNQDSFVVLRVEGEMSIYGVFDGHGRQGHDVSNFVKEVLPKLIVQEPSFEQGDLGCAFLRAFQKTEELIEIETTEKRIDASASGTTCTIAIQKGNQLWIASVGDSRCVLVVPCSNTGELKAVDVTRDHKPDIPEERERIIREGGVVIKPPSDVNHRVYVKGYRFPGLAMSRALGDLIGHHRAGISATPEIRHEILTGDESLVLCSDGVWEFLSSQEAVDLISQELKSSLEMEAAEKLCKTSWDRWIAEEHGVVVDDITALVAKLSVEAIIN